MYNNKGPLRIKEPSAIIAPLFKCQFGPVRAEIHAPPKGWTWEVVTYFRVIPDPRNAGKWIRVPADRGPDQKNKLRCVKAVTAWLEANKRI